MDSVNESTPAVEPVSPFDGYEPLPGLEHLGRHIRDAKGFPSGSPANFEALRGQLDPSERVATDAEIAAQEEAVRQLVANDPAFAAPAPLSADPTSN